MSIWRTSFFVAAVVAIATTALYAFGPPDLRWKLVSALPEALRGPRAYVLLEIDQEALRREAVGNAADKVRDALNAATPIIAFRDLASHGDDVHVQIVDLTDAPRALAILQSALAPSEGITFVLQPSGWIVARFSAAKMDALLSSATHRTEEIVRRRLAMTGALARISDRGDGRILAQTLQQSDPALIAEIVARQGRLTVRPWATAPSNTPMFAPQAQPLFATSATTRDGDGDLATLAIEIDRQSQNTLCRVTRDNIGRSVAIYLDGIVTDPLRRKAETLGVLAIDAEICGGPLLIAGLPAPEARAVAQTLDAGVLPAPLIVLAKGLGEPPRP